MIELTLTHVVIIVLLVILISMQYALNKILYNTEEIKKLLHLIVNKTH